MDPHMLNLIRCAEEAVTRLVDACGKGGPLHTRSPKEAAQVSRTGKWLLYATAALQKELKKPEATDGKHAG